MEEEMAELINLKEADNALNRCFDEIDKLKPLMADSTRKVWSDAQRGELARIVDAMGDLASAVSEALHNNRDGRGAPPARAKVNSMMDRAR